MSRSSTLWKERLRSFRKARRALLAGEPEALHDLRVSLRRTAATARALERKKVARDARRIVRSLSPLRQLEVDRRLLARVAELGFLSSEGAAVLDARWDELAREGEREAQRALRGKKMRRLERRLSRLAARRRSEALDALVAARRRADAILASPPASSDRALHRYRLAVKRARYHAEDLVRLGATDWSATVVRERALQDVLGHWNDIRLFRERLLASRNEAESRGAVTLALELHHLAGVLEETIASARRDAERAIRTVANVVPLAGRIA